MNWLFKVAAFKILSALPGGTQLYRFSQKHITHSLIPSKARVQQKIDVGFRYWKWLETNDPSFNAAKSVHVDLGTGWHPTIPLLFYSLGVNRQYLFDISPIMDRGLIYETIKTFCSISNDPGCSFRSRLQRLPDSSPLEQLSDADYLMKVGMSYYAPYMEKLAAMTDEVDLLTCTQVMYHIPVNVLPYLYRDIYKSLKKGGRFMAVIHLIDMHSNPQNGLSPYNFYRYSHNTWNNWINSSIMPFSRLKARDYRKLLEESGFHIRHFEIDAPSESDLRKLEQIPIHDCFREYSKEELGAKHLFFVAEKV